jgi:hypothetical protein
MSDNEELKDLILLNMLLNGSMEDGDQVATLTVKGFVGANIVAARVALKNMPRPITDSQIDEIIQYLETAETSLEYLRDVED